MGRKEGNISENFFSNLMFSKGINYRFVDDWYDYLVCKKKETAYLESNDPNCIKVEVKSCSLTIKAKDIRCKKETNIYRVGRFDFTKKEHRDKIKEQNVWIALIIRHRQECLFYGFIRGNELSGARYISIHLLRNYKIYSFEEFVEENNIEQKHRDCPFCGRGLIL